MVIARGNVGIAALRPDMSATERIETGMREIGPSSLEVTLVDRLLGVVDVDVVAGTVGVERDVEVEDARADGCKREKLAIAEVGMGLVEVVDLLSPT